MLDKRCRRRQLESTSGLLAAFCCFWMNEAVVRAGCGFRFCILHTYDALLGVSGICFGWDRVAFLHFPETGDRMQVFFNIISLVRSGEDEFIVDDTRTLATDIETCNGEYLSGDYNQKRYGSGSRVRCESASCV